MVRNRSIINCYSHLVRTVSLQASLASLPRELRNEIFGYLFQTDLNCTLIDKWSDSFTPKSEFQAFPHHNKGVNLHLPWVSIMQTCRLFAAEIREQQRITDEANHTYVMDITACAKGRLQGPTTWRKIL